MKRILISIVALISIHLVTIETIGNPVNGSKKVGADKVEMIKSCNKEKIMLENNFVCPFWQSEKFEGTFCRTVAKDGSKLLIEISSKKGGTDSALTYNLDEPVKVDDVPVSASITSNTITEFETGSERWWAGPKMDVRETAGDRVTWQETYIVENASDSPDVMHERRMKRIKEVGGKFLGTTEHDGAVYKHYCNKHNSWMQYWAVRQEYRENGTVSIKPILEKWRDGGMPNYSIRRIRANIEFSGKLNGQVIISDVLVNGF